MRRLSIFSLLMSLLALAGSFGIDYVVCDGVDYAIAPLVAALASLGAAAVGTIGSSVSTNSSNNTQEDIARENRDWQSGENQLNRQWSERMWNLENQYNTPSAQVERLRAAGINPYLVGAGVDAGNAGSASAPASQGAPSMPQTKTMDWSGFSSAGSDAVSAYMSAQGVNAQAANQRAQAERTSIESAKDLYRMYGRRAADAYIHNRMKELDGVSSEDSLFSRQAKSEVLRSEYQSEVERVNAVIADKYGEKAAQNSLAISEQTFNKMAAEMGLMSSESKVNESKCRDLAASYIERIASAYKLRKEGDKYAVDAQTASLIQKDYVNMVRLNALSMGMDYTTKSAFFDSQSSVRQLLKSPEWNLKFAEIFEGSNDPDLKILGAWLGAFGQMFNSSFNVSGSFNQRNIHSVFESK